MCDMGSDFVRNKHLRRKRKSPAEKRHRQKVHRRRAVALGVPEEKAAKMDSKQLRAVLRRPKKTAARYAKKK
jgi:hypothetical protein